MRKIYNLLSVLFLVVGMLSYFKAVQLFNIGSVDGEGIGIYFLGIEINDRVHIGDVTMYAERFQLAGILMMIFGVILLTLPMLLNKFTKQRIN